MYRCMFVQKEFWHNKSFMGFKILRSLRSGFFFQNTADRTVFNFSIKTSCFEPVFSLFEEKIDNFLRFL